MVRADGATITGELSDESWSSIGDLAAVFSIFFWIGMTLTVLFAAALFARFGGRQLSESVTLLSERPSGTILSAVVLVIGLPMLAIMTLFTVVGIPIGLSLFIFLIPALWFFGYLVLGTWLGTILLTLAGRPPAGDRPYLAAIGGAFLLQFAVAIPFFGGLVLFFGGPLGAGALVYRLIRGRVPTEPAGETRAPIPAPAGA
jgi:hypothetical protein